MQVRNAVWLPWLPQFQWYDGIKSRKSELHAVWLIVSMTTTDWKGKKKKRKPSYVIYRKWSWRCWRTSSLHPQVVFFPLFLSFLLSLHSDGFTLGVWLWQGCFFNIKCTDTQSNIIAKCKSSLGEAREDDRGCLLKTAPFSCLPLINIQFSVILYKNIIHTLWYTLKTFWILAGNYLANYQPGYPVFCV